MIKAVSAPNIALIKYWGNRDVALRLPAADSLSMVLDAPTVEVSIEPADIFSVTSYDLMGNEKPQSPESLARLQAHFEASKGYLRDLERGKGLPKHIAIVIRSAIPPAIGLASSAAVFSALGEAYAALAEGKSLNREDVSILSRLGSGSAGRNAFGGYVALTNHKEGIASAYAEQVAEEDHWLLHDIIIVPSIAEKKVGSTAGHATAKTSPYFAERLRAIPARMRECIGALRTRDFEKLQVVSEEDALDMHRVMETQVPPLQYRSKETHRIVKEIKELRATDKLNVLFTMDAGETVHLICTEDNVKTVTEFAEAQKNCLIFTTKTGKSSRLVSE